MASGIPKRAGNVKKKEKRKRSWDRNQIAKKLRIEEQQKREKRNRELGTTGKERATLARKKLKSALSNSAAGNVTDLGDFTQYADQEDLLEI